MMQFYNDVKLIYDQQNLFIRRQQYEKQFMKHIFYREIYKIDDPNSNQYPYELISLIKERIFSENQENDFMKVGLELQMQRMYRKNIYVGIKWLIFIHQIIQITHSIYVLAMANKFIQLITPPHTSQKIQEYIRNKLFNPYRQYLKKLALKKMHKMEVQASQQELKFQIYGEYNFINYSISQFSIPIRQLTPFLQMQYPYLNLYIELISHDLMPIYKRVLHSFEENLMSKLTFIEIQNMASKIVIFSSLKKDQKSLEATTGNSSNSNKENSPNNVKAITAFNGLQNSNVCFNFFP